MKIAFKTPLQISEECKTKPVRMLSICYAFVFIIFALYILFLSIYHLALFGINKLEEKTLTIADFEAIGIETLAENELITTTDDAQLLYENKGNVKSLSFKVETSTDPGEWVLFYQSNANAGYSTQKMVYAKQVGDMYVFELPANTIKVRFDLGVIPSNTMVFNSIQINTFSFLNITNIGTHSLFYFMILPIILYAVLLSIKEFEFLKTLFLKFLPKKT